MYWGDTVVCVWMCNTVSIVLLFRVEQFWINMRNGGKDSNQCCDGMGYLRHLYWWNDISPKKEYLDYSFFDSLLGDRTPCIVDSKMRNQNTRNISHLLLFPFYVSSDFLFHFGC